MGWYLGQIGSPLALVWEGRPWWWLSVVCDLLTFSGCVAVLVVAVFWVRRRRGVKFPWVFWLIFVFMVCSGAAHLTGVFHASGPAYGLWVFFKAVAAVTLWVAALAMIPLMGRSLSVRQVVSLSEQRSEAIDKQRRGQRVLKEANRRLKNNNRDLKRFTSVISHDLLEPLRTIHGYASLLIFERAAGKDRDTDHAIARIDACAQRLENMIKGLMRVTRLGLDENPRELVDMDELVSGVVSDLQQLLSRNGAAVEYAALPKVFANRALMRQVFQNLIANAVTYRSDAPPRVQITAEREEDVWRFAVADNGVGIPEQSCKRVFDAFRRLRHRTDSDHLGLGLSIVQTAVEWHNGEVWVESAEGRGSTFYFTLPTDEGPGDQKTASVRRYPAQLMR